MLSTIVQVLRGRTDIAEWTVRAITSREQQLYAVPGQASSAPHLQIENRRAVVSERYQIDVLCRHEHDGQVTVGSGNATLLPGDDIGAAVDAAALMASLVRNPPHSIPAPTELPDVALVDSLLLTDAGTTLDQMMSSLEAAVAHYPLVRITAAECFAQEATIQLYNSRGIEAAQHSTSVDVEWVLIARSGEQEVESFVELTRRQVADLQLDDEVRRQAQYAIDLLSAATPPTYQGPVVLRNATLATFLRGGVLETLSSAASKYNKVTPWEIGQPIFRNEVHGDPFTAWANRRLPNGANANRFDDDGLPAQRVLLIDNNRLNTFTASQRYADYLDLAPTGAFGDLELPPGSTAAAALLAEPHVEIVAFSWFNPDSVTGDFTSEIRLGYIVADGQRTPFKGGVLVGNVLDALTDVQWSGETGFYGDYQGPTTARFAKLLVAGNQPD